MTNRPNQTGSLTVTTTYTYDALHRLTGKSYNDGATPPVSYFYDQTSYNGLTITNGKGRRTGMSDGAGAEAWSYDVMGRVLTSRRTTNSVTKDSLYEYNLDGSVKKITYPSGRAVTYTPDAAGRMVSAVDVANGINYATLALYAPHGALSSVKHGVSGAFAGITRNNAYSNRLQPTSIAALRPDNSAVLNLGYNFDSEAAPGVQNNGNVGQIINYVLPDRTQTFTYDQLNRIDKAQTQATTGSFCWGLDHGYDIWANLLSIGAVAGYGACTQSSLSLTVSSSNRISSGGFTYDAAGNMTTYPGYGSYSYDAENRMVSTAGVTYTYDAEGQRVARRTSAGTLFYYFKDHLGSSRVIMQAGQALPCYDADYLPFGYEKVYTDTCPQNYKFTGHERDAEAGCGTRVGLQWTKQGTSIEQLQSM